MTHRKDGDTVVVAITGRLDAVSSPDFDKEMNALMEQGENAFILDLEKLEYISSAGLRSILAVAKKLKGEKGGLCLASLQEMVREVFEISGFDSIIPIYDSLDSALEDA